MFWKKDQKKDQKSVSWKEDRETLRCMTAEDGLKGPDATYVYTLISHMRNKLHMHWYKKRHGGWQVGWAGRELEFNTTDGHFCPGARIASLEDQAKFLTLYAPDFHDLDLAMRVVKGYAAEDICSAPMAQLEVQHE
jgi:hypothetical protein